MGKSESRECMWQGWGCRYLSLPRSEPLLPRWAQTLWAMAVLPTDGSFASFPSANSICMGTDHNGVTDLIVRFVKVFVLSLGKPRDSMVSCKSCVWMKCAVSVHTTSVPVETAHTAELLSLGLRDPGTASMHSMVQDSIGQKGCGTRESLVLS